MQNRTSTLRSRKVLAALGGTAALGAAAVLVGLPTGPASAAAALSCDGLVAGQYVPTAATTGVKAGSKLTRQDPAGGVLTIRTAGTTIENADVHGRIDVRAANVTIRNSIVRGAATAPTAGSSLVAAWDAAVSNLVLEGVTLRPQAPSPAWNGISGHDYTARCVNVYETTDGFGAFNTHAPTGPTNVRILQSYCHDLAMWSPDAGHSDNLSHTDCFQGQGAKNVELGYNNLSAFLSRTVGSQSYAGTATIPADPKYTTNHPQALSAIMVNDVNVSGVRHMPTGWNVHHNRISGGSIAVNAGDREIVAGTDLGTFHSNVFDDNQYLKGHTMDFSSRIVVDTADNDPLRRNTWANPIVVRHNG